VKPLLVLTVATPVLAVWRGPGASDEDDIKTQMRARAQQLELQHMGFCEQPATKLSQSGLARQGGCLETSSSRVLVVEDSEPFRKFFCSTLKEIPGLQIVGEVSDGLQAVLRSAKLQADLIVLDIGLPSLYGIEAARRIRKLSAVFRILFVSQESSADVAQEALGTGGAWVRREG